MTLRHLDLFSGIGGFALAARMVGGIETQQFCEIDPYCQKVLAKNFPGVPIHGDVTTFTADPGRYDLITGGFPCQDISCANPNGRGLEGQRSGLFFELMRIVRECRPRYVLLENVAEMLRKQQGRIMGAVLYELSQSGFNAEWQTISAASVGAPHLRERVFVVAYRQRGRYDGWWAGKTGVDGDQPNTESVRASRSIEAQGLRKTIANSEREGLEGCQRQGIFSEGRVSQSPLASSWATEPGVLRVANGVPSRVDRIRGLGNAIVPQVGAIALQRVLELEAAS